MDHLKVVYPLGVFWDMASEWSVQKEERVNCLGLERGKVSKLF